MTLPPLGRLSYGVNDREEWAGIIRGWEYMRLIG